ncbi:MAG: helix-turn-helix domain-containing protein [Candidatus Omnitrophica bacterium]|nr:helix-turn-helix domain-containing protein [Candidatus Omnitrophota bacterium]
MLNDTTSHNNGIHGTNGWQWLTVGEVARAIGLTEERVRQLIRQRKIRATKIGGWLVRPSDLSAFIQSRTNVPGES